MPELTERCPQCYRAIPHRYAEHWCVFDQQPQRIKPTTAAEQAELSRVIHQLFSKPMQPHCPPPGIYPDVPFADYLAWPAVSQSSLKPLITGSPLHYKHAIDNPPDGDRDCFRFGRLCHSGKLEPLAALGCYIVMPDLTNDLTNDDGEPYKNPKATKAYKERVADFKRVNADKEIVAAEWYEQVCGIVDALNRHDMANRWLRSDTDCEVSLTWIDPLTGIRCKARCDKLSDSLIVDLKTTSRPVAQFERELATFGYDVQGAFYADGLTVLGGAVDVKFGIVAVERSKPHAVRAAALDVDTLIAGRTKYRRALRRLAECRDRNRWPGPDDPLRWTLPSDALPDIDLTQSGATIANF